MEFDGGLSLLVKQEPSANSGGMETAPQSTRLEIDRDDRGGWMYEGIPSHEA